MKNLVNEIMDYVSKNFMDYASKNFDVITRLDVQYNVNTMLYSARVWFASGKVIDFATSIVVVSES